MTKNPNHIEKYLSSYPIPPLNHSRRRNDTQLSNHAVRLLYGSKLAPSSDSELLAD